MSWEQRGIIDKRVDPNDAGRVLVMVLFGEVGGVSEEKHEYDANNLDACIAAQLARYETTAKALTDPRTAVGQIIDVSAVAVPLSLTDDAQTTADRMAFFKDYQLLLGLQRAQAAGLAVDDSQVTALQGTLSKRLQQHPEYVPNL